jgi:hypothetical protein
MHLDATAEEDGGEKVQENMLQQRTLLAPVNAATTLAKLLWHPASCGT